MKRKTFVAAVLSVLCALTLLEAPALLAAPKTPLQVTYYFLPG
jgi:hypothetical protein